MDTEDEIKGRFKQVLKRYVTDFYFWWHSAKGTNTRLGYEQWEKDNDLTIDVLMREAGYAAATPPQTPEKDNPYWYWPQCDVEGCEGVSGYNGMGWRETGYWCLCSKHSQEFRDGKPQPKMKQSSIDKEQSRDKVTGYLPPTPVKEEGITGGHVVKGDEAVMAALEALTSHELKMCMLEWEGLPKNSNGYVAAEKIKTAINNLSKK